MTALDCDDLVELVTEYLDGALDAETERRFVDHLAGCDPCSRYLDQIRQITQTLGSLSPEALPDAARQALLDAFRNWKR